MLTVRFPNGQAITYNDAHFLRWGADAWHLYRDKEETQWIATFTGPCIVETVAPCRIENPVVGLTEKAAFDMVRKALSEGRHPNGYGSVVAEIKAALERFNRRTWGWRR